MYFVIVKLLLMFVFEILVYYWVLFVVEMLMYYWVLLLLYQEKMEQMGYGWEDEESSMSVSESKYAVYSGKV